MKHNFIFILMLSTIILGCGSGNSERPAIKQCFNNYKTAILNTDGNKAITLIDQNTVDYYSKMLKYVQTGSAKEVKKLSLTDKIMVLGLRHRANKKELENFDAKTVFKWSVDNGMIGKESVQQSDIGFIKIKGDRAKGNFKMNGKTTPYYYYFSKEKDGWKIDLTSMLKVSEEGLIEAQKQSGMTEDDFLFFLIEAASNKKVGKDIWEAPL